MRWRFLNEVRVIVNDLKRVKKKLVELGGKFIEEYKFIDYIFVNGKDILRLRVVDKTIRSGKKVKVVIKMKDKVVLKRQFDTKDQGEKFIRDKYSEFEKKVKYSRVGWQYNLGKSNIYVENIRGFNPTVEIESADRAEMNKLFREIGFVEKVRKSMPDIMLKVL